MKKIILALLAVCVIAGSILFVLQQGRRHTVKDFGVFPCDFSKMDEISLGGENGEIRLVLRDGHWWLSSPANERIDVGAEAMLKQFSASKVFVDFQKDCGETGCSGMKSEHPMVAVFRRENEEICRFELGKGDKPGTVDSERRWLFVDGRGYRSFIPMMDFGPLFEQPLAGWRDRRVFSADSVVKVRFRSGGEAFELERGGMPSESNPQGWQVKLSGGEDVVLLTGSSLDETRVATILDLISPFYVDEWADGVSESEASGGTFGGRIEVTSPNGVHEIQIGNEVEFAQHPAWSWVGQGARYVRISGEQKTGIVSVRRLMGLFPSLIDMRSRRVWSLDTEKLSKIEVESGVECVRYEPENAEGWRRIGCDGEGDGVTIESGRLGQYARALKYLEAFRYVSGEEREGFEKAAELRLYEGLDAALKYRLELGVLEHGVSRRCRILDGVSGAEVVPMFIVSEKIVRILLEDQGIRRGGME